MRRTITSLIGSIACLTTAAALPAQHADTGAALEPGRVVRVTLSRRRFSLARPTAGVLQRIDADSIHLRIDSGAVVAIPRSRVRAVEVFTRTSTRAKRVATGVATGAAIAGLGWLAVTGLVPPCDPEASFFCADPQSQRRALMAGVLAGAGVAAIVGATESPYTWRPVQMPADARIGLVAARGVVAAGLRF